MRHEVKLRLVRPLRENLGDLVGDALVRYRPVVDQPIRVEDARLAGRREMRLDGNDALQQSGQGKVAVESDVVDLVDRGTRLCDAELGRLTRRQGIAPCGC